MKTGSNGPKTRPTRVVQPSRAHDHLYDPVFTASSFKDHHKVLRRQMMTTIERVPVFSNLFSETGTFPRHGYRLKKAKAAPPVTLADVAESHFANTTRQSDAAVQTTGKNRYLFFNRPLIPYMQAMPAEVILAPVKRTGPVLERGEERTEEELTRTVACQTIFRESESQTDPYSPDYILDPEKAEPEVLQLCDFSYGSGLPVGLDEVKLIERTQEKQRFEATLPPIVTEADFERRRELLQAQELKEWKFREQEIIKIEQDRLNLLVEAIRERENEKDRRMQKRIEAMRETKARECDNVLLKVQKKRVKVLRKISRQCNVTRKNEVISSSKRDIIAEYANFASNIYAPLTRDGRVPKGTPATSQKPPTKALHRLTNTYEALLRLETTIPAHITNISIQKPPAILNKQHASRKGQAIAADLDRVDEILRLAKNKQPKLLRPLPDELYKKALTIVRPATPSVAQRDTRLDIAVTLLQRVLRGRRVQNDMYKSKQSSLQLIQELRTPAAEAPKKRSLQRRTQMVEKVLESIGGRILSWTLDFLAKDVVRRQQEQHISKLVQEAQETRRIREATEAGTRQAEEILRNKEEAHFVQIMEVHHTSIGFYLDEIIEQAVEDVCSSEAEFQCASEYRRQQEHHDLVTEDSAVVHDLLSNFVFPEVDRQVHRHQREMEEARYVVAAHQAIKGAFQKLANGPPQ